MSVRETRRRHVAGARNYERMMRNVEGGPALPPAARGGERNAPSRAAAAPHPPAAGITRISSVMDVLSRSRRYTA